ncbi:MAG: hypothetical protein IPO73_11080 [Gemmatimonadetes bacterium]|nr:hypothetical protein [Gemmatimonadota bacterium]
MYRPSVTSAESAAIAPRSTIQNAPASRASARTCRAMPSSDGRISSWARGRCQFGTGNV